MEIVKVKIINKSDNPLPKYETLFASGMDVYSNDDTSFLYAGHRKLVKTGLFVAIPEGYEIQVRPRSGFSLKQGITVLNSPGTIDADYRGEIGIILYNTQPVIKYTQVGEFVQDNSFKIDKGMKIAQIVLVPVIKCEWEEVEVLPETERGKGGYGSTDKK